MGKRRIWSEFLPPGFTTVVSFLLASIVSMIFENSMPGVILFLVCAIAGETWQILRRNKARRKGELPDIHPLSILAVVFALIGVALLVLSVWMMVTFFPYNLMHNGWAWFAYQGILFNVGIISVATVGIAIAAIIRAVKAKKYGVGWATYSIILAVITLWMWHTFLMPIMIGMNDHFCRLHEESRLENVKANE